MGFILVEKNTSIIGHQILRKPALPHHESWSSYKYCKHCITTSTDSQESATCNYSYLSNYFSLPLLIPKEYYVTIINSMGQLNDSLSSSC